MFLLLLFHLLLIHLAEGTKLRERESNSPSLIPPPPKNSNNNTAFHNLFYYQNWLRKMVEQNLPSRDAIHILLEEGSHLSLQVLLRQSKDTSTSRGQ